MAYYPGGYYPSPPVVGYPPVPGYYPPARRSFYIISDLNGKVLDIRGGHGGPGAEVIMFYRKMDRSPNQLWYLDEMGCIRSSLNEFAPECRGQGDHVRMQPFRGDPRQQWMFQGNRIVNRVYQNECLDIEGGEARDEVNIISWAYKGSANQHWRIDYV